MNSELEIANDDNELLLLSLKLSGSVRPLLLLVSCGLEDHLMSISILMLVLMSIRLRRVSEPCRGCRFVGKTILKRKNDRPSEGFRVYGRSNLPNCLRWWDNRYRKYRAYLQTLIIHFFNAALSSPLPLKRWALYGNIRSLRSSVRFLCSLTCVAVWLSAICTTILEPEVALNKLRACGHIHYILVAAGKLTLTITYLVLSRNHASSFSCHGSSYRTAS